MEQRLLHTPEGVRDIYSGEYARKKALLQKLHRVVELSLIHISEPTRH